MKKKCGFCKKDITCRIVKKWSKKYISRSTDKGGMIVDYNITDKFALVRLYDHEIGILRRHACKGSGKKFRIKIS